MSNGLGYCSYGCEKYGINPSCPTHGTLEINTLAAQLAAKTEQLADAETILVGVDRTPGPLLRKMVEDHFAKYQEDPNG